jgi:regulator of protease activity HflC (stomatin/prohibitin superfamily)
MLQAMRRVDLRPEVARTPNAAVTWHVTDPARALEQVADYRQAMQQLTIATLAKSLAGRAPDALVFERHGMEEAIRKDMEGACSAWGIEIDKVVVNR